jgi:formylglycine-generating enzyme required for sulfatase activity
LPTDRRRKELRLPVLPRLHNTRQTPGEHGQVSHTTSFILPVRDEAIELVCLPGGEFEMGSTRGLPLEIPVHPVVIERPLLLGKFPITQGQWTAVMGKNPSVFTGEDRRPVDSVSWEDARAFCLRLSGLTGRRVRLPAETEWEYACRAGSTSEYFFGDDERGIDECAWYELNSREGTHPVGLKRPNAWGLFDLIGNVWEWCEDVWHADYTGAPSVGAAWMEGESAQPRRVLRGGAWDMDVFRCRSAYRSYDWMQLGTSRFGMRVVVER